MLFYILYEKQPYYIQRLCWNILLQHILFDQMLFTIYYISSQYIKILFESRLIPILNTYELNDIDVCIDIDLC